MAKQDGCETIKKEDELTELELMDDDTFYSRFSPQRKRLIVAIVSLSCFLSPLSTMSFLPAVSIIAEEFGTTGTVINVSNAIYNLMMAISTVAISPLGSIYGKRIAFLVSLTLFLICTVLTGLSQNLAMFFVFRALSALFGTLPFSVGSQALADIYKPVERGNALGLSLLGSQLGPALGPVLGGIIVTYTSWRVIFWVQTGLTAMDLVLAVMFLPETSRVTELTLKRRYSSKKVWFVTYNPLRVLINVFRYKNLTLAGAISVSIHYNMFSLLTPIRYVVDPRFNLTKPVYGGLFYLAPGLGYVTGAFIGGRWADYTVRRYIRLRGRRIPEDRLRSMVWALGIVIPSTTVIYGWCLDKEKGGMALPIIMLFLGGMAQTVCYPSVNTYCVDSMPELRGDAIAGNYFVRFVAAAVSSASVLPELNSIGVGWTCTISSLLLCLGSLCCVLLISYGEKLRLGADNQG
uniref:MFS transporter n=1 Tax=Cyberlindnera americana TaxID=36016 RepID=A0A5P8N9H5_9ASCO|nr:MFS transporter [Cyberlindnera americana]